MSSFKPLFCAACLLAAVALYSDGQENRNPNFDFSGVIEFYKVADILLEDVEPTDAQWSALFDTPGHAELRREFEDDFLKKFIRAACKPSEKAEIARIKAKYEEEINRYFIWFSGAMFDSLEYALTNREKILAAVEDFKSYPYSEESVKELLRFLPEETVEEFPQVAFIIFNDSRGYTPVIMSLNLLVSGREALTGEMIERLCSRGYNRHRPHVLYFAHEFFHHYRDRAPGFAEPEEGSADYRIMWFLDQIENEGIADQINAKPLSTGDGIFAMLPEAERIRREQAAQPEALRKFDELLARIHDNPGQAEELGRQIGRHIERAGHPAGFYMSNVILEHSDLARLVEVARSPFRFFYLYNEAAKLDGNAPIFGEKAIALIRQLEEKYGY